MARSTRLVMLIKNKYTLWGRKRFLLPVTYFFEYNTPFSSTSDGNTNKYADKLRQVFVNLIQCV